jgi:hypothetical protein
VTRAQLEHLIRAAADLANDDEIIVLGSQAVLGQFPEAPSALLVSVEADLYPKNHPGRSDLIDGSIGEGSPFHDTYGYYAQGVAPETATLPQGWRDRLVPIRNENTRGATGWCLEIHDLLLSKCVAGRAKDVRFLEEAARHGLARREVMLERLPALPVSEAVRGAVRGQIFRAFG